LFVADLSSLIITTRPYMYSDDVLLFLPFKSSEAFSAVDALNYDLQQTVE